MDVALDDGQRRWTFAQLDAETHTLAERLRTQGSRVMATLMDNTPAWVVADRAAAGVGIVHVPLPPFFTPEQIAHALGAAGVDTVLTTAPVAALWPAAGGSPLVVAGQALVLVRLPARAASMPAGTAKITFTSGTTGAPKGVCLSATAMESVAAGLVAALEPLDIRRHLCALPFSVLLENIAGLMAPLMRGATCVTLPLAELGLAGSSSFDAARFHQAVVLHRPDSIILLPQMLRIWTAYLMQTGQRAPEGLKLVAVGGAAVGARLLQAAHAVGIPAFEGYGLSEGASVQTLNLPGAAASGSAGRPLPHAQIRIAGDGEIEVTGSLFLGYLGQPGDTAARQGAWWPTGDLGQVDADGFLHISGRKKHVLITAFGRNVSPEWVETALGSEPAVAHAVVFGDGEPALWAVLWPTRADVADAVLQAAVDAANTTLPDYARVHRWVRAQADFTVASGCATANGRPQRAAVLRLHGGSAAMPAAPVFSPLMHV